MMAMISCHCCSRSTWGSAWPAAWGSPRDAEGLSSSDDPTSGLVTGATGAGNYTTQRERNVVL